ncbi:hypothetical protein [Mycobacterium sp. E1747]|uniref:hypothetical protein n=1 Tax=Mycobacterium sp. E1747 TaxID=1834128 RepID=UPI0012EA90CC|nr:hypothetical protein [Mycobacterium sp. E1747]
MFFIAVNPQSGDSVFVHVGRQPGDLEMWWAQTIAVLADGRIVADRSFGRAPDDRGPATGNLRITCVEPLRKWHMTFDGAGELTNATEMATRVVGAGLAVRMSFHVEFSAAAPVCDFARILGSGAFDWANAHQEQNLWSKGQLRIGDETFDVTGVGFRDHSTGPRDFSKMGGDHFAFGGFPASRRTFHSLVAWSRETEDVAIRMFGLYENGIYEIIPHVEMTGLRDNVSAEPRTVDFAIRRPGDDAFRVTAEVINHFTITLGYPNENINGALLGRDDVLSSLAIVKFRWSDGESGAGLVIRDYRPSTLPSERSR